jgi:hypothetical protein
MYALSRRPGFVCIFDLLQPRPLCNVDEYIEKTYLILELNSEALELAAAILLEKRSWTRLTELRHSFQSRPAIEPIACVRLP